MREDDLMDALLRERMAAPAPTLSPGFDAKVMRRVRPRRLTASGRLVMTIYALVALAATGWLMRDLPAPLIAASVAVTLIIGAGISLYVRVAAGHAAARG